MSAAVKARSREEYKAQEERLRAVWAGVLALLMRLQLAVPDNDFLSADFFNQAFTLHGTVMMFLFAVPIFEAVAIFLLPPMLGAREMPFPRLGAF
ncbi:MAG: cytochrome ubiquinol oxidase subunit I, partial [Mesorhizobium sp.]